jgi:N-dimethylarginine dimethylaminohydrolase
MTVKINSVVLMSDARNFDDSAAINPYMDKAVVIDRNQSQYEHDEIQAALKDAGVKVIQVPSPAGCQDGVYTANWALVQGNTAILSRLPNARKAEEAYAEHVLKALGKKVIHVPKDLRFSGQGDALPCGKYLFAGSGYRTDKKVHKFLATTLDLEVISLQTVPQLDDAGQPVINASSGWPDSFFYDIDLALAVLSPNLIAWCPEAFLPKSQAILRALPIRKIEVSLDEAMGSFACNLVSTGKTVIMGANAPIFKAAVESEGLTVVTPEINELVKGGGYIRCTTLTLN